MSKGNLIGLILLVLIFICLMALKWPDRTAIDYCDDRNLIAIDTVEGYACVQGEKVPRYS